MHEVIAHDSFGREVEVEVEVVLGRECRVCLADQISVMGNGKTKQKKKDQLSTKQSNLPQIPSPQERVVERGIDSLRPATQPRARASGTATRTDTYRGRLDTRRDGIVQQPTGMCREEL